MMDNLPVHKVAERFHMTRIRSSSPQCPFIEAKGDRTKLIHNGGALVHDVAYTSSHAPRALANRRVTGDPDLVAAGWFKQKFFPEPVDLALSLGCGFGGFERVMIAFGLAKKVHAIDISPGAIERARAAAAADAIGDKIKYEIPDLNEIMLPSGTYDAIYGVSSLHHVFQLEHMFRQCRGALKPGALLFLDEYIRPSRLHARLQHHRTYPW
jgi:SAM-dependent methyltransferase